MRPRLPDLKIRLRIALTIFVVASSLLVLMSAGVYVAFDRQLRASLDDSLRLRAVSNRAFVELSGASPRLVVPGDPALQRTQDDAVLRLYGADGRLITDGSPDADIDASESSAVRRALATRQDGFATGDATEGNGFRLLVTPLIVNGSLKGALVSGLEISRVTGPLGVLRLSLLVAVPLTSLLLGLGGYWIARRALRPVSAMTRAANEITSGNLARRIPAPPSRDELGLLASTLNSMIARLAETMERERRFTADASHELRTPLASIETSVDVTLSQARSAQEYQRVLRVIRTQAQRLHVLTRQLLLLSRLDASQIRAEFVDIDLNGLLEAIGDSFAANHPEAAIEVIPSPEPVTILGDVELLARAFTNVLENAVAHVGPNVRLEIAVAREGSLARTTIRDNGHGIPPELAGEVFQRFRRGDESRHDGGSGLGLAIVDAIVSAHGGDARLDASEGQTGACFVFHFPLAGWPTPANPPLMQPSV